MKILVTGAAGFIGYHLVTHLLKENHDVVGIDNINDYYNPTLKLSRLEQCGLDVGNLTYARPIQSNCFSLYRFIKLDIEDFEGLKSLFTEGNFEVVINLAAQAGVRHSLENPRAYIRTNIEGFLNVLECCRYIKPSLLIYASSSSVYGLNEKQPFSLEDKVETPISIYAASKKSNELMAHTYHKLFGINAIGFRFFTVYGPWGRPDMAPMLFANSIINNKLIKVFNFGDMERDFTYIDDVINGIYSVIERSKTDVKNRIFNLGSGKPIKLIDFIKGLEKVLDKQAEKKFMKMQAGDVKKTWADISELNKFSGYEPKVGVLEGTKRFTRWYLDYFSKKE